MLCNKTRWGESCSQFCFPYSISPDTSYWFFRLNAARLQPFLLFLFRNCSSNFCNFSKSKQLDIQKAYQCLEDQCWNRSHLPIFTFSRSNEGFRCFCAIFKDRRRSFCCPKRVWLWHLCWNRNSILWRQYLNLGKIKSHNFNGIMIRA